MKVMVITGLYTPYARGGAETVCETIVEELSKYHDVCVVTTHPWHGFGSLIPRISHDQRYRVFRFFPLNIFSPVTFLRKPFFLRLFWHLLDAINIHAYYVIARVVRREKPDVVLTHNLKGIGLLTHAAIRRSRVHHIHTVHDLQLIAPSGILRKGAEQSTFFRILSSLSVWFMKPFIGSPDVVIFPSSFLRDWHTSKGFFPRSRIVVRLNPIFHAGEECSKSERQWCPPFWYVYMGQLETHKGILFLIEAFQQWRRRDVRLLVAGRGSQEHAVCQMITNDARIAYCGYIDRGAELLTSADWTIVPSLCYENAPQIIGESYAVGTPVIAARIGGIPECVREQSAGLLFEPGDQQSLLLALEQSQNVGTSYASFSRAALAHADSLSARAYCDWLTALA